MDTIKSYYAKIKRYFQKHGFSNDVYFTYHVRPHKADEVKFFLTDCCPNVGIVIQGGIKYENDFTVETVRLYKKLYPESKIIVSTWDYEKEEVIRKLEQEGATVCISRFLPKEKRKGCDSVNLQRQTSLEGVKKAIGMGCKYILKTRTDQRIYASCVFTFMYNLLNQFPLRLRCNAKQRIISCSLSSFSNRLYNISDMFIFGQSDDVLRYFSCPVDERDISTIKKESSDDWNIRCIEYSLKRMNEIYFASYYIESCGFDLKWTIEDSDYYRRELFLIIDDSTIDLYWPKYNKREFRWRNYETEASLHPVGFKEWYNDLIQKG